jgi:hypothetical protein
MSAAKETEDLSRRGLRRPQQSSVDEALARRGQIEDSEAAGGRRPQPR